MAPSGVVKSSNIVAPCTAAVDRASPASTAPQRRTQTRQNVIMRTSLPFHTRKLVRGNHAVHDAPRRDEQAVADERGRCIGAADAAVRPEHNVFKADER